MIIRLAAIGIVLGCISGVASAADVGVPPAPMQRFDPPPASSWTGFYIGVNGGYGFGDASAATGGLTAKENLSGPLAGGQVGGNWQMGAFVVGFEADAQWSDINNKVNNFFGVPGLTATDRVSWFGTYRARLGAAVGNFLFYGTAGGAYGEFRETVALGALSSSASSTKGGWTVGAGVEAAFGNWSAKGEYLYVRSLDSNAVIFGGAITTRVAVNVVRVGLNYRLFNPSGY